MAQRKKHIVHLICHLAVGGLERKLQQLLLDYPADDAKHTVIPLEEDGKFSDQFNACATARLSPLRIPGGSRNPLSMLKRGSVLVRALKKLDPVDVVHSWSLTTHLYLAPLMLIRPSIKGRVLAMDLNVMIRPPTEDSFVFRLGNQIIRRVAADDRSRVVSISSEMRQGLLVRGYRAATVLDIPNGVNCNYFRPDSAASGEVRRELGFENKKFLLGIASRHGPTSNETYKDVPSFLDAAASLKIAAPDLYSQCGFILCGQGTENGDLQARADRLGISDNVRILGPRHDMRRLYSSWHIANSCSLSEPFGLVVPEAMACGTPCVVTEASLFPEIVGPTGRVVPVRDPVARASAWQEMLKMPAADHAALGRAARQRVLDSYDHGAMVRKYVDLYATLSAPG